MTTMFIINHTYIVLKPIVRSLNWKIVFKIQGDVLLTLLLNVDRDRQWNYKNSRSLVLYGCRQTDR